MTNILPPRLDYIAIYGRVFMEASGPLSWDEEGMMQALAIGQRSGCQRARNGCAIAVDRRTVVHGYNGPPGEFPRCNHDNQFSCDKAVHAETNAIYFAAKKGIPLEGATAYCTTSPCKNCARAIIQSGISRVVYLKSYRDSSGRETLKMAGIPSEQLEIWHTIPNLKGYEASSLGRIRSWRRRGLPAPRASSPFQKKLRPKSDGLPYLVTTIDGVPRYVHHLVLEAFVGPRPEGMEACHNDGDCQNNELSNLRWASKTENEADKNLHGTRLRGENHRRAKLTEDEVRAMRRQHENGASLDYLAAYYAVAKSTACRIVKRKLWTHI